MTTKSDLDLLVITRRKTSISQIKSALQSKAGPRVARVLGLRISPYLITKTDAIARYAAGDELMLAVITEGRTLISEDVADVLVSA